MGRKLFRFPGKAGVNELYIASAIVPDPRLVTTGGTTYSSFLMSHAHQQNAEGIDVGYVAHLARLHLSDDETALLQRQLDHILAYVDDLKKVDVQGVSPMSHPVSMNAPLRDDAIRPSLDHDAVMANAPDEKNGQFVVPQIIE